MGLYNAGVLLAGGTDEPYLGLFMGDGMHRELDLLVEAGISPIEAINICTHNGVKVLGVADKTGSLATGMDADIILVAGDPSRISPLAETSDTFSNKAN